MTELIQDGEPEVSRWLESLRPSSTLFCRAEVRAPWGFRIGARDTATFHVLTEGGATLEVDGVRDPMELDRGDLVLLPTGAGHALRDAPDSPLPSLEQAVGSGTADGKWVTFGGDGERTVMLCGACRLGPRGTEAPARLLPTVVRHRLDQGLTDVAAREAEALASGTEAVLLQLLTLIVMQALRAHLTGKGASELGVLFSPDVARAVTYMHDNLSEEVRLEDLCRAAAASRTVLSKRFDRALGVSPVEYLRLTRLSRAAELLTNSRWGVARIARSVGYQSASSFTRAFKKVYGTPPGRYRAEARRGG